MVEKGHGGPSRAAGRGRAWGRVRNGRQAQTLDGHGADERDRALPKWWLRISPSQCSWGGGTRVSRKPWRWPWHREPSFAPSFHSSTGVLSEFVVCLCVTGTRPSQGLQPSVLLHLRGPTVCWRMEQKKPLAPHRRRTQIGRTGAPKSGRQAVCAASLLSRAAAVVFAPRYHPPHGLRDNENLVCMAAATVPGRS